jgi:hypothetical protein
MPTSESQKIRQAHKQPGDWYWDMSQRKILFGIQVVAKSARSEVPDFTSKCSLLYGPEL